MFSKALEQLLFSVVRPIVVKREMQLADAASAAKTVGAAGTHAAGANPTSFAVDDYFEWRRKELEQQFSTHFDLESVRDKRVLDFGCGSGHLSLLLAGNGASSVEGIDLNAGDIAFARTAATRMNLGDSVSFKVAADATRIEARDASFDLITCFDVLEHIAQPRPILNEWMRVLRPGGRVLIWWQPYYHPFGHHLMSYLPVPWVHAIFSPAVLASTCNRVFLMPEYKARFWELDERGNKRLERLFTESTVMNSLNKMTIGQFEHLCRDTGFGINRREAHGFSGHPAIKAVSSTLSRIPLAREFMTAFMIYELKRP